MGCMPTIDHGITLEFDPSGTRLNQKQRGLRRMAGGVTQRANQQPVGTGRTECQFLGTRQAATGDSVTV